MKEKQNFNDKKNSEDVTKYGEFIPSFFSWQTFEEQKRRCEELNLMTKNEDKNKL